MELANLIEHITSEWKFDKKAYPKLDGKTRIEILEFSIRHILLHQSKSQGRISDLLEQADHAMMHFWDQLVNNDATKLAAVKMVVNALELCHIIGLSAEDIEKYVRQTYPSPY